MTLRCIYIKIKYVLFLFIPRKYGIYLRWFKKYGNILDLKNPLTYNEKLQWLKMYGKKDEKVKLCCDKYKVRLFVEKKIGKKYLNKLYGLYDNISNVPFNKMPKNYVLKATHDSGSVMLVRNGEIDKKKLEQIKCKFKLDYSIETHEWCYEKIKPMIIVEKYLESEGDDMLKDYKVFCFSGVPKIIQVDVDRFIDHKRVFYDCDWNKLDLEILYPSKGICEQKPEKLKEMLSLSEVLSREFDHVRIDWYIIGDQIIFGEMTFFHESGIGKFNNYEWEIKMGSWINLYHNRMISKYEL